MGLTLALSHAFSLNVFLLSLSLSSFLSSLSPVHLCFFLPNRHRYAQVILQKYKEEEPEMWTGMENEVNRRAKRCGSTRTCFLLLISIFSIFLSRKLSVFSLSCLSTLSTIFPKTFVEKNSLCTLSLALFFAIQNNDIDGISLLVEKFHCDINLENFNGETPLSFALKLKRENIVKVRVYFFFVLCSFLFSSISLFVCA